MAITIKVDHIDDLFLIAAAITAAEIEAEQQAEDEALFQAFLDGDLSSAVASATAAPDPAPKAPLTDRQKADGIMKYLRKAKALATELGLTSLAADLKVARKYAADVRNSY